MKIYFLKLLWQILFTKIDEEPHSQEYTNFTREYENQQKPIAILAHQRRAFGIFRYGLDSLIKALTFDNQIIKHYLILLTRT